MQEKLFEFHQCVPSSNNFNEWLHACIEPLYTALSGTFLTLTLNYYLKHIQGYYFDKASDPIDKFCSHETSSVSGTNAFIGIKFVHSGS